MNASYDKKRPVERPIKTPPAECLECRLFLAFIECFGLTKADVKQG